MYWPFNLHVGTFFNNCAWMVGDVYQPLTFTSLDILDHQIDITIILCFILWKNNCSSS